MNSEKAIVNYSLNNSFYILDKNKYIVNENNKIIIYLVPPPNYGKYLGDIYQLDVADLIPGNPRDYEIDYNKIYEFPIKGEWNVKTKVNADYYIWIEDFEAEHPTYGKIIGNLSSNNMQVDSIEAFKHFTDNNLISLFCLGDI